MKYSDKLKDPRWQKKRLEIMSRDGFCCQFCGDEKTMLTVHHKAYNGEPWEQDDTLLITLCENCHSEEEIYLEEWSKKLVKILKRKGFTSSNLAALANVFENVSTHWVGFDPNLDILKFAIEDENSWRYVDERFWAALMARSDKENRPDFLKDNG